MNEFKNALKSDFGAELSGEFVRRACYYPKIDCIEYMSSDEIAISERVDGYLTLLWNEDFSKLLGFKLKGFRFTFNTIIKPIQGIIGDDFNSMMVAALQNHFTELGDGLFSEKRQTAYKDVIAFIKSEKIAVNDDDLASMEQAA